MLKGLYKVEMHTVHGSRRGVLYVYDGKMMGGNSAFAFIGTYQESDTGEVSVNISTVRHNHDPNYQPLFKTDKITLTLTQAAGRAISFRRPHVTVAGSCLQFGDDAHQRRGRAAGGSGRTRCHNQWCLFHSYPDA